MSRTKHNSRKRHQGGENSSDAKRRKREHAEQWANTRGDSTQRFTLPTSNDRFDAFYQALGWVDGNEWKTFMDSLHTPLPACFHMNPSYAFSDALKAQLHDIMRDIREKAAADDSSKAAPPFEQLVWYPHECGFKLGADRRVIRKDDSLALLHQWLVRHTDNGNITRQEAVSMVPPLALNVQPHHKCLDMCAAPGSKTSQLLEIVNRSLDSEESQQGLVVANDADTGRAYMLVHQCRRIKSPLLIVTTHMGQNFPPLFIRDNEPGFFDRVLCDVPCSGDGTLRKNPEIWSKWSTKNSMSLHPLQLSIALRGLLLLKPGGLMVYSTCSMSPYEDEAVVAELLRRAGGALELVDAREFVPLFRARAGLSKWPVIDDHSALKKESEAKRGQTASSEEQRDPIIETKEEPTDESVDAYGRCSKLGMELYASHEAVPEHFKNRIKRSMFPPSSEEAAWMHLERCLRCAPHDEDTGGFFVATFRKAVAPSSSSVSEPVAEPVEKEEADAVTEALNVCVSEKSTEVEIKANKGPGNHGMAEYLCLEDGVFEMIKNFYGLGDSISAKHLFVRKDYSKGNSKPSKLSNGDEELGKSIYYISLAARQAMDADKQKRLKVVAAGMKVLERKVMPSGGVEYRLVQEGIHLMAPHLQGRKVEVSVQDFCNVLGAGLVSLSTLSTSAVSSILRQPAGTLVLIYRYSPADVIVKESDTVSGVKINKIAQESHIFYALCWKGQSMVINVVCKKVDVEAMKHQLEALGVYRPKIAAKDVIASSKDESAIQAPEDDVDPESDEELGDEPGGLEDSQEIVEEE